MGRAARVDSVRALRAIRAALIKYREAIDASLSEGDSEIYRTTLWLKNEQTTYWKVEHRKRSEQLNQAKIDLKRKEHSQSQLGGQRSFPEERRLIGVAKRRLEEAEQKMGNVRKWIRQLEQEKFDYMGTTQRMRTAVDVDIPNAVAWLDQMTAALENYEALAVPTMPHVSDAGGVEELPDGVESVRRSVGGEVEVEAEEAVLRGYSPEGSELVGLPVEPGAFSVLGGQEALRQDQQDAMVGLAIPGLVSDDALLVAMAETVSERSGVYLEHVLLDDSGHTAWVIGPADGGGESDESVRWVAGHVDDVLGVRNDWGTIFTLPPGSLVVVDGGVVRVVLDVLDRVAYRWSGEESL